MAQLISKVCRVCGEDVSRKPRTKDAHGNYFCQPCYQTAASAPAVQASEASEAAAEYICSVCSGAFDADGVYDDHGSIICKACFELRSAAMTRPTRSRVGASSSSAESGTVLALRIGFVLALALLALSLVAAIVTGLRSVGEGIATAAASVLLWGGLAFACRVALRRSTDAQTKAAPTAQPLSNRSLTIALSMIAVALIGTFVAYYQMYMAPIHTAVVQQNKQMDESLSKEVARLESQLGSGDEAALLECARKGDLAGIQSQLDRGASINARATEGFTPLASAVVGEQLEAVKLLLRCGADPDDTTIDPKDQSETTPLAWAALMGKVEIAATLVAGGADPTKRSDGRLPYEFVPKDGPQTLRDGLRKMAKEYRGGSSVRDAQDATAGAMTRSEMVDADRVLRGIGTRIPELDDVLRGRAGFTGERIADSQLRLAWTTQQISYEEYTHAQQFLQRCRRDAIR